MKVLAINKQLKVENDNDEIWNGIQFEQETIKKCLPKKKKTM